MAEQGSMSIERISLDMREPIISSLTVYTFTVFDSNTLENDTVGARNLVEATPIPSMQKRMGS